MTYQVLCLLVPGSDNIPMHHPSAKEVWFSYQKLRAELESINSTLKLGKKSMLNINTGK